MKQQIANRLGAAHVRDTVMQFVDGSMTREQAMASLGVGKTRLYELRTSFLAARAAGDIKGFAIAKNVVFFCHIVSGDQQITGPPTTDPTRPRPPALL